MTDITAELAALPNIPKPSVGDSTRELLAEVRALKAYLAIAERHVRVLSSPLSTAYELDMAINNARAYLQFREKEQQT